MVAAPEQPQEQPKLCANCHQEVPGGLKCSRCKAVYYCGRDCQKVHYFAGHKAVCKPPPPPPVKQQTQPVEPDEIAPIPSQVLCPYTEFVQLLETEGLLEEPPVGLQNCGNTCFANSLLQCLLHTQPLNAYLLSGAHSQTCRKPGPTAWCLLCEMQKLAQQVQAAQSHNSESETGYSSRKVVDPRAITRSVKKIAPHFRAGQQEDAHDLYINMLDQMEGVLIHAAGGKDMHKGRTRETTLMGHCFTSYICYQTVCTSCGWISQRYDTKVAFELDVLARTPTIETSLAAQFADETLDDNNLYKCDHCKQKVRATRHSCLEVAPNVCVVMLKRFGLGRHAKNNRKVAYKNTLDLTPFRALGALDNTPATYQLYGVLVHVDMMGSTSFGHYVSYVRLFDNTWWLCDDSLVQQVEEEEVLSQKAYMLFYMRHTPRPAPDPTLLAVMKNATVKRKVAPVHDGVITTAELQAYQTGVVNSTSANGGVKADVALPNGHLANGVTAKPKLENGVHPPEANGIEHGVELQHMVRTTDQDIQAKGIEHVSQSEHASRVDDKDVQGKVVNEQQEQAVEANSTQPRQESKPAEPSVVADGSTESIAEMRARIQSMVTELKAGKHPSQVPTQQDVQQQQQQQQQQPAHLMPTSGSDLNQHQIPEASREFKYAGVSLPVSEARLPMPSYWIRNNASEGESIQIAPASKASKKKRKKNKAKGKNNNKGSNNKVLGNAVDDTATMAVYVNLPGVQSATDVQVSVYGGQLLLWVPGSFVLPVNLAAHNCGCEKSDLHSKQPCSDPSHAAQRAAYVVSSVKYRPEATQLKITLTPSDGKDVQTLCGNRWA